MPEIPVPKPNNTPQEAPLIRTSEPRTIIRTNQPGTQSPIKGKVYTKEPTFKEKLRRSFLKEDIRSVRDYVLFDVLIPNVKRSVFDMVMGALGQTLGIQIPKSYPSSIFSNNSNRTSSGYRDYTAISSRGRDPIQERNSMDYDRYRVRDIIFDSKEEALSLLELMTDICDANGVVSVFTFFEKASHGDPRIKNGNHYTNHKWGWRSLNGVYVTEVPCPDFESGIGYIIDFPDARPI